MKHPRFAGNELTVEETEADGFIRIGVSYVFDDRADFDFDAEFLFDFADETSFEGFAWFDFAAGKLPEVWKMIIGPSLGDKQFSTLKDQRGGDIDGLQSKVSFQSGLSVTISNRICFPLGSTQNAPPFSKARICFGLAI